VREREHDAHVVLDKEHREAETVVQVADDARNPRRFGFRPDRSSVVERTSFGSVEKAIGSRPSVGLPCANSPTTRERDDLQVHGAQQLSILASIASRCFAGGYAQRNETRLWACVPMSRFLVHRELRKDARRLKVRSSRARCDASSDRGDVVTFKTHRPGVGGDRSPRAWLKNSVFPAPFDRSTAWIDPR